MDAYLTDAKRATFDKLIMALLPIAFIGSGFLNMYAFVLDGHRHEWFRRGFVLGIQGIVALLLFIKVLDLWKTRKDMKRFLIASAWIPIIFALLHLWALLIGTNKTLILENMIVDGGYLLAESFALIIIYAEKKLPKFFHVFRYYAIVLSPVFLFYCIRFYLPDAEYGVENLGVYPAMSLSYTLLTFCLFLTIEPVLFKETISEREMIVDYLLFILFAVAMSLAQCKGAMICVTFGTFILLLYALITKTQSVIAARSFVTLGLLFLLFSTVLFPNYGQQNKFVALLEEKQESAGISFDEIQSVKDVMQSVMESANGSQDSVADASSMNSGEAIVEYVTSGKAEEARRSGTITEEDYNELKETSRKLNNTNSGGRLWLWTCAVEEIKSSPWVGHGPMFYQDKYGTYPHNFFLEVGTDFGVPATLLVAIIGLYVFAYMLRLAPENAVIGFFVLYVLARLPGKMVSGSCYSYDSFFEYGFCFITLLLMRTRVKADIIAAGNDE